MENRIEQEVFNNNSIFNKAPGKIMSGVMFNQCATELESINRIARGYTATDLLDDLEKLYDKFGKDSKTLQWTLQIIYISNTEDDVLGFYDGSISLRDHANLVDFLLEKEVKGFEKLVEAGFKKKI
jgi:hypothetical protein